MMEFLAENHLLGLVIGLCTFLIIGVFHPLVIKGEYYFGVKIWWVFMALGMVLGVSSWLVGNVVFASLLGVGSFSSFWGILEVFEQRKRVEKGWFPRNPRRKQ